LITDQGKRVSISVLCAVHTTEVTTNHFHSDKSGLHKLFFDYI